MDPSEMLIHCGWQSYDFFASEKFSTKKEKKWGKVG
jgi:hypothetical protein